MTTSNQNIAFVCDLFSGTMLFVSVCLLAAVLARSGVVEQCPLTPGA